MVPSYDQQNEKVHEYQIKIALKFEHRAQPFEGVNGD